MSSQTEIELKFLVPESSREAIAAEMTRESAEHRTLAARYIDTEDRRLARAGIAWRLRREGDRWVQTLKAAGASALERFEHEVIRPGACHDADEHVGTAVGEELIRILRAAECDEVPVGVRFQTEVQRSVCRIRTVEAAAEIAFDEGRLLSGASELPVREVEFELVSGSVSAMLALAEHWRERFGLIYDPRSKAERGDRLAEGSKFPPLRKALRPEYSQDASAARAFGAVLDECLAHVSRNAIGLIEGDPKLRVEHVHQTRVGIRRLRSALRSFRDWTPPPPDALVEELKALFASLGMSRDSDVLDRGVVAALTKAGAPPLGMPAVAAGPDPVDTVRAPETQRLLLAWITWRATLSEAPARSGERGEREERAETKKPGAGHGRAETEKPGAGQGRAETEKPGAGEERVEIEAQPKKPETGDDAPAFHRNAERRLRRGHRGIVSDWKSFDELDETSLHSLRKRIKRQRYAVEFFGPILRRRTVDRYLEPLTAIQDRMGELNDLFVARERFQALVSSDPAAWFALGWLAARIAEARAAAKPELRRLAKAKPPKG